MVRNINLDNLVWWGHWNKAALSVNLNDCHKNLYQNFFTRKGNVYIDFKNKVFLSNISILYFHSNRLVKTHVLNKPILSFLSQTNYRQTSGNAKLRNLSTNRTKLSYRNKISINNCNCLFDNWRYFAVHHSYNAVCAEREFRFQIMASNREYWPPIRNVEPLGQMVPVIFYSNIRSVRQYDCWFGRFYIFCLLYSVCRKHLQALPITVSINQQKYRSRSKNHSFSQEAHSKKQTQRYRWKLYNERHKDWAKLFGFISLQDYWVSILPFHLTEYKLQQIFFRISDLVADINSGTLFFSILSYWVSVVLLIFHLIEVTSKFLILIYMKEFKPIYFNFFIWKKKQGSKVSASYLSIDLFLICFCTTSTFLFSYTAYRTSNNVLCLGDIVYNSRWYQWPTKLRPYILLMVLRSQSPCKFIGFKVIHFNLKTFRRVRESLCAMDTVFLFVFFIFVIPWIPFQFIRAVYSCYLALSNLLAR